MKPRRKVATMIPMMENAATFTGGHFASAIRMFVSECASSWYVNLYSQTVSSSYLTRDIHCISASVRFNDNVSEGVA